MTEGEYMQFCEDNRKMLEDTLPRRSCSCGEAWADDPGHDDTIAADNEDLPPWLLSNERQTVWELGENPDNPAEYDPDEVKDWLERQNYETISFDAIIAEGREPDSEGRYEQAIRKVYQTLLTGLGRKSYELYMDTDEGCAFRLDVQVNVQSMLAAHEADIARMDGESLYSGT